jgi:hypothetical protein
MRRHQRHTPSLGTLVVAVVAALRRRLERLQPRLCLAVSMSPTRAARQVYLVIGIGDRTTEGLVLTENAKDVQSVRPEGESIEYSGRQRNNLAPTTMGPSTNTMSAAFHENIIKTLPQARISPACRSRWENACVLMRQQSKKPNQP